MGHVKQLVPVDMHLHANYKQCGVSGVLVFRSLVFFLTTIYRLSNFFLPTLVRTSLNIVRISLIIRQGFRKIVKKDKQIRNVEKGKAKEGGCLEKHQRSVVLPKLVKGSLEGACVLIQFLCGSPMEGEYLGTWWKFYQNFLDLAIQVFFYFFHNVMHIQIYDC